MFQFKQSLGVIGGKPNVALYFIGCVGKEVIYLDPHHTQRTGFVENKETEEQIETDITYHCKYASRINILKMDPSVAAVRILLYYDIKPFSYLVFGNYYLNTYVSELSLRMLILQF